MIFSTIFPQVWPNNTIKRVLYLLVAACLSALLTGCGTFGAVDASQQANARRIGVVSLINVPDARGKARHPGVLPPEAAGLTGEAVNTLAATVAVRTLQASHPGAQVVALPEEAANVRWSTKGDYYVSPLLEEGRVSRAMEESAVAIAARHHLDLVVFLAPWWAVDENGGIREPGCGFWARSAFGLIHSDVQMYLNSRTGVCDGKTGKLIGRRATHQLAKVEPDIEWKNSPAAYGEVERGEMKAALTGLLDKEIPRQLHGAGLAP